MINKINFNITNSKGETLFLKACETGKSKIVEVLIKNEVDVNMINKGFILAIKKGHIDEVKELIKNKHVDVNAKYKEENDQTAFMIAVRSQDPLVVSILLENSTPDFNITDSAGNTVFMLALQSGNYQVLDILITAAKMSDKLINEYNIIKMTSKDTINDMFKGTDKRIFKHTINQTVLMQAATKGKVQEIKLLLTVRGIDVNLTDRDGNTALMLAANKGYANVCKELLKFKEIDVEKKNKNNKTSKDLAIDSKNIETINLLKLKSVIISKNK